MAFWLTVTILYFTPSLIASTSGGKWSVLAVNTFLGWTVVGWVVSLVMALRSK